METVEVTARWDKTGRVTPLRFNQGGSPIEVETTGRQWKDADGLHVLVQARAGRIYELIFDPQELLWHLGFEGKPQVFA